MLRAKLTAVTAALALLSAIDLAEAASLTLPSHQTIVSCNTVCVRKAAAPRPGDHARHGYLYRVCTNNLTGQTVSWAPVVPAAQCG